MKAIGYELYRKERLYSLDKVFLEADVKNNNSEHLENIIAQHSFKRLVRFG